MTAQEDAAYVRSLMKWCSDARKMVQMFEDEDPNFAILILEGIEFIEADPRAAYVEEALLALRDLLAVKKAEKLLEAEEGRQ